MPPSSTPRSISARWLLTDGDLIDHPRITLDADGIITGISSGSPTHSADDDTLSPALLDIHTHGVAGHDVMEGSTAALDTIERFLASRGVAHYLPTTVTAPVDTTLRSLEALAVRINAGPRPGLAQPLGIHLEGPFLSHVRRGVHPVALLQPPDIGLFDRLQEAAGGHIRLITIAPEIPAAIPLIAHATAAGVLVSIGHTDATSAETRLAIDAGARSATHTFNAMRKLDQREPGVLGTVLDDVRLFAELICDGVHVAPELVRLWLKAKGPSRAILVTDSMAATGMPEGRYLLGGLEVDVADGQCRLSDGTLAGSVLTLDRAVLNLRRFTGAPLPVALGLASRNPAALLNRPDLAEIRVGQPANLSRFSPEGRLLSSYIGGQLTVPAAP